MTAQAFLSTISQLIYLALFGISLVRLVRLRTWVALDTFLFFGVIAGVLLLSDAARLLGFEQDPSVLTASWIAIALLPYLLLRLADDFQPRRWWTMVLATLSVGAMIVLGVAVPQPWPVPVMLAIVAHFVIFGGYASFAFLRESLRSHGGTQRRMQAVALGSGLIAMIFLLAGVSVLWGQSDALSLATQVISLAAVVAYFIGFAPPAILQRGWQEPAIRSALARAAELVALSDPHDIGQEYAQAAIAATGAQGARVGIWDEASGMLQFRQDLGDLQPMAPGEAISGRAFEQQRALSTHRAERDAPERAEEYRRTGIRAIVSAPITSGDRRLGVLTVYAVRPPVFTDDVVAVVRMLAEQAALVLRSHELLREAAQVKALVEMTRMKDDFLSVVAHDVRTPLTTILINAELIHKALSADDRNARRAASLHGEAVRLKQLVEDYLDVVRAERGSGQQPARRERQDLVDVVRTAISGLEEGQARVDLTAFGPVPTMVDSGRILQLVQNLVGNALKYSDASQRVQVHVGVEDDRALIRVTDRGIGVPDADLPFLFERFHRGSNTDDRRYRGLGLGLYICRQVAQEHGGDISVTSKVGDGTTFTVLLGPVSEPMPEAAPSNAPRPADGDEELGAMLRGAAEANGEAGA